MSTETAGDTLTTGSGDVYTACAANPLQQLMDRSATPPWPALAVLALGTGLAAYFASHALDTPAAMMMAMPPVLPPSLIDRLNKRLGTIQARLEEMFQDAWWSVIGPFHPHKHEFWRLGKMMEMEDLFTGLLHHTDYDLVRHRFKQRSEEERLLCSARVLGCFVKYRYRSNPLALLALSSLAGHLVSWLNKDERRTLLLYFTQNGLLASLPTDIRGGLSR